MGESRGLELRISRISWAGADLENFESDPPENLRDLKDFKLNIYTFNLNSPFIVRNPNPKYKNPIFHMTHS